MNKLNFKGVNINIFFSQVLRDQYLIILININIISIITFNNSYFGKCLQRCFQGLLTSKDQEGHHTSKFR